MVPSTLHPYHSGRDAVGSHRALYRKGFEIRLFHVRTRFSDFLSLLLFAPALAVAQAPPPPGVLADPGRAIGSTKTDYSNSTPLRPDIASPPPARGFRPDFVKALTIESFGYDSSPVGEGYEDTAPLSNGPFTAHELECPLCVIRQSSERTRYTLPPFGAEAKLYFWGGRGELASGVGGINAWRSDNVTIQTGDKSFRRDSSFNDAWLGQAWLRTDIAVDPDKHVRLGALGRYVMNFGPAGRRHWNTLSPTATFVLGH